MANSAWHWLKTAGRPHAARISRWWSQAHEILRQARRLRGLADDEITGQARELAWRIREGCPLENAATKVFALVCESARRTVNMVPYQVQVVGGLALAELRIAEMQTGEGKTLTATLPVTLYAMVGRGCHVVTVNDYLAQRDTDWMGPIYQLMGLTVGCVASDAEQHQRKTAYSCDITYGTATEMGFDFLRDRLQTDVAGTQNDRLRYVSSSSAGTGEGVQRDHFFALIDEADSVLIDDAGTPLIIGLAEPNSVPDVSLLHWANLRAADLEENADYVTEPDRRTATLTENGSLRVLMSERPQWLGVFSNETLLSQVEVAVAAHQFYHLDREYVVNDGEVTIVDESTGRMMDGRKWQRGLHQAVEVKEGVAVTEKTQHAAQITIQSFFRRYRYLAGMTGTALPARNELKTVYRIGVSQIPTNRPCLRSEIPARIYASHSERNQVLVERVGELIRNKRAVLIGTPSVGDSEGLGTMLDRAGVRHVILNARHEAREARIVQEAGRSGRVTIATNMAGRGTDIIPHDEVIRQGGMHVIATSIHSSARIDRQLVGRTARQGNPGSFQFLLSLEDPFLRVLPPRMQNKLIRLARERTGGPETIPASDAHDGFGTDEKKSPQPLPDNVRRYFERAQKQLEKTHSRQRKQMLRAERERRDTFRRIGLDPYLECAED